MFGIKNSVLYPMPRTRYILGVSEYLYADLAQAAVSFGKGRHFYVCSFPHSYKFFVSIIFGLIVSTREWNK